ncbi:MAG: YvcK family protein [Negativicutes bacterium]|nr:YvcK family protein [Negativicutes bacterium]
MKRFGRWFSPGMRVKRWLVLILLGFCFIGFGFFIVYGLDFQRFADEIQVILYRITGTRFGPSLGGLLLIAGLGLIIYAVRRLTKSVTAIMLPDSAQHLADLFYQKRQLKRGPKLVVIGGGSGLSVLIRGLKQYTSNLTAIVTMADDGGSSGRLREELGTLPPGDIRNCILAMANAEPSLQRLFEYRFSEGSLAGHNFGNLFLAAMTAVNDGNFEKAVQETSKVLAVGGQVYPSTLEDVTLVAETQDGQLIRGESAIGHAHAKIRTVRLEPAHPKSLPEVIKAIHEADAVILGPGSLYTSIIPNLLVLGISEAITASAALTIYVCNVMAQPGETDYHRASDYVKTIMQFLDRNVLDYAIVNTGTVIEKWVQSYSKEGGAPVEADLGTISKLGVKVIQNDYLKYQNYVRHDEVKLAEDIIELVISERYSLEQRRDLAERLQKESVSG